MNREWQIVWDNRDQFLAGFLNTIQLTFYSSLGSVALGLFLCMALMSSSRVLIYASNAFVDVMKCVPFLLFAYVIYYALPMAGLTLSNWYAGLTALLLYNVAYMSDAFRAGWRSLPREIIDAGHAFGFRGFRLVVAIVLPAMLPRVLPILGNQVIQIIKDSSFLTIIAVPELTHAANAIQSNYYIPFSAFLVAVVLYWTLCLFVEFVTRGLERRLEVCR